MNMKGCSFSLANFLELFNAHGQIKQNVSWFYFSNLKTTNRGAIEISRMNEWISRDKYETLLTDCWWECWKAWHHNEQVHSDDSSSVHSAAVLWTMPHPLTSAAATLTAEVSSGHGSCSHKQNKKCLAKT